MTRAHSGRRVLAVTIAMLALLVAMAAFQVLNHVSALRKNRAMVDHSHAVIEATQALFSLVQDAETGQRGYQLSTEIAGVGPEPSPEYLRPYTEAVRQAPAATARLRELAAKDSPEQQARIEAWTATLNDRLNLIGQRVELIRQGRAKENLQYAPKRGLAGMALARRQMAEIVAAEKALLDLRVEKAERTERLNFVGAVIVRVLAIIALLVAVFSLYRSNRRLSDEIRDREAAETARLETDALYRAVFEHSADYIFVINVSRDGVFSIAEMNPSAEDAVRADSDAVRGVDLYKLLPKADADLLTAYYRRVVAERRPLSSKDKMRWRGGRQVWESVLVPVFGEDGRVERIVGSSRDVTERERAEAAARRSQRMEAVGHLTGGVAHDFNNLLQVIRGNLELISPLIAAYPQAAVRVQSALHGADRAAQLTRQLLAFARRQPLEPRVVDLGRLVGDMADMLRRTLGEAVVVKTAIAEARGRTLADPAQVESAVLNLALNARDAMPGGGQLVIEIADRTLDAGVTSSGEEIAAGPYVMLAVSDTGHGMSRETLEQVFEPFFTTKGEEKGTGLGLSMVYGFVKQSNGHIQIYSEPGKGTTVKIYLPRTDRPEEVAPPPPPGLGVRGRSAVVLVVEDDPLVQAATVGMLRTLGYDCLHADDGRAALEVLDSGAKVDLLFTDVVMPGPVKSPELAREAQRRRPGLPVLFTSGYAENAILHQGRLEEGAQLLSKPFSRDELARKISTALAVVRPIVLVVEDDALVRLSALDMIRQIGCTPVGAADAEEALKVLKGDGRIDVLFTDIGLPGVRGPELAEQALRLRPGLKVVFASGYGEAPDETRGRTGSSYLAKPYEQDELAQVLVG